MSENTIIDGIAASEHLDSSGESLSITGMDISSLGGPDSILNWEHSSKEKPAQVVGKVTFAKKILKKADAKNKRELYYWNKVKKPFVYVKAELFDGLGHSGAQDVAALLKYRNKDKGKDSRLIVGFSIEGGKMDKKGMVVTKCIARDVAITVKPCNKVCDAEIVEVGDLADDFLFKNMAIKSNTYESFSKKEGVRSLLLEDIKKGDSPLEQHNDDFKREADKQSFKQKQDKNKEIKKLASQSKIESNTFKSENNMRKALVAGMMNATPSSLTGMAALSPENMSGSVEDVTKESKKKKSKKKDKKLKKNQPLMSNRNLRAEVDPRMDVKTIQRDKSYKLPSSDKEFSQEAVETKKLRNKKYKGESISERTENTNTKGFNAISSKNKVNESYVYNDAPKSTADHESIHKFLGNVSINFSPDHKNSLVDHVLSSKFFHPDDIKDVSDFVKNRYNSNDKDEHLTHILDIIQNPSKRKEFHSALGNTKRMGGDKDMGQSMDRRRMNRLKSGWKKASKFASNVSADELEELHSNSKKNIR